MVTGAVDLDPALRIAVPEGHGLGEVHQLVSSNEGASIKIDECKKRKNAHEGLSRSPVQPPREECEREYRLN